MDVVVVRRHRWDQKMGNENNMLLLWFQKGNGGEEIVHIVEASGGHMHGGSIHVEKLQTLCGIDFQQLDKDEIADFDESKVTCEICMAHFDSDDNLFTSIKEYLKQNLSIPA